MIKTNVATINEQLTKIEKSIVDVRSAENLASTALARIETRLNPAVQARLIGGSEPIVSLSDDETQLIREILKPVSKGAPQQFNVGDFLDPGVAVTSLPDAITSKLPKLLEIRYFFDRSGAIMLVANLSRGAAGYNVIVGIVPPS